MNQTKLHIATAEVKVAIVFIYARVKIFYTNASCQLYVWV